MTCSQLGSEAAKAPQLWDVAPRGGRLWAGVTDRLEVDLIVSEEAVTLGKEDLRDCGSGRGSVCLGWGRLGGGGVAGEGVVRVRAWSG